MPTDVPGQTDPPGLVVHHGPTPLWHALVLDRAVAALLSVAMRDSPLNAQDYGLASAIKDDPGITASQLADQFSVPLTTLAEWVGRLISLRVVRRERDPQDRRRHQLWVTQEGQAIMAAAHDAFGRGYLAFLEHLPVPPSEASAHLEMMTLACRQGLETLERPGSADHA